MRVEQRAELLGDVNGWTAEGLVGGGIDDRDDSEYWIAWISISRVDLDSRRCCAAEEPLEKSAEVHRGECVADSRCENERFDDRAIVAKRTASVWVKRNKNVEVSGV